MNRTQKRILAAWAIVAVALLLFPPFVFHSFESGARMGSSFGFILVGPRTGFWGSRTGNRVAGSVDVGFLAIMEVVAGAIAGVLYYANRGRPPEQGPE